MDSIESQIVSRNRQNIVESDRPGKEAKLQKASSTGSDSSAEQEQPTCGICMESFDKDRDSNNKYGLLDNCSHIFCFECIITWRCTKSLESPVTKACPACRAPSYFVTPSNKWVTDPREKRKLMLKHKYEMSKTPCRRFQQGRGSCRYGIKCYYQHAYPAYTQNEQTNLIETSGPTADALDSNQMSDITIWYDLIELLVGYMSELDVRRENVNAL
uniref:E3 ubiquitin-protein ligase makorin-1-like n=1 Tax=Styela clava TaxID=7725 RepID=UPI00193AD545|nr:E3 ubiquitin-protein ligase makorin-1-like [Styela clava]